MVDNRFNIKKLFLSKWTAVEPKNKERHFMVSRLLKDENDQVFACVLEAVITTNEYQISPDELKNSECWAMGWK